MPAPVHRLKKDDIIWLARNRCKKHRHSYLEHYDCFLKENPSKERIGFLDIETTNLKADCGPMLCYCIKKYHEPVILSACITKKELCSKDKDKNILKQLSRDLNEFDTVVTYYGAGFDIPFIRTRCVCMGVDFPEYGQLKHKDIYFIIKHKFKLRRNSLQIACEALLGNSDKTHLDPMRWFEASQGNTKQIKYIYDHCVHDVEDLEKLYDIVNPFRALPVSSC